MLFVVKLTKEHRQVLAWVPQKILDLVEARQLARKERRFQDADRFRNEIQSLGYELEDVTNGTKVKKRHQCNIQKSTVTD